MTIPNSRHLNIVIVVMKRLNVQFFSHFCLGKMPLNMENFLDITFLVFECRTLEINVSNFSVVCS